MPPSTLGTWARVHIVTSFDASRNHPSIPFVGLAEGLVVLAFRRAGVSLQHIRKAAATLEEVGIDHPLASQRLFTDGASVLPDYAADVVRDYLRLVTYGSDGWPEKLVSPATPRPVVLADPKRSFGQPIFIRSGVRVQDVLDRWRAGETLAEIAEDFGVPPEDVEDILRVLHDLT